VKAIFIHQVWATGQECLFLKTLFICLDEADIWRCREKKVANFTVQNRLNFITYYTCLDLAWLLTMSLLK